MAEYSPLVLKDGRLALLSSGDQLSAPAYTVSVLGKNTSDLAIAKGTAVMATGTLGASGIITIAPMDGTANANAMHLLGVASADVPADGEGDVVAIGKIRGFDTTAWSEGQVLWVSPTTPGALTNVEPSSGQLKMPVAFVVTDHHVNGEIMVRVTPIDESLLENTVEWGDRIFWPSSDAGTATVAGVSGEVRSHTKGGDTVYRFIPSNGNSALDAFYVTYSGGALSGLIATRG